MKLNLEDVDDLKAGRVLDAHVAQYIYGYHIIKLNKAVDSYTHQILDGRGLHKGYIHYDNLGGLLDLQTACPVYSVSNGYATDMISKLRLALYPTHPDFIIDGRGSWECHCPEMDDDFWGNKTYTYANTIPLAVCRTALKVVLLNSADEEE
jgi:hypothetical protein